MKKQISLGVVGGLGPETGMRFCLEVIEKIQKITQKQPHLVLENLPISKIAENQIIKGKFSSEHLHLLKEAVLNLNHAEVDFIAIPCNTVHIFLEELRKLSKKPIISIIEETIRSCKEFKFKKVGLLASSTTINQNLFSKMEENKIRIIIPNRKEQEGINEIILNLLQKRAKTKDKNKLLKIINRFKQEGAEAIILGCTDLPLIMNEKNSVLPLVDTLNVLEKAVIGILEG